MGPDSDEDSDEADSYASSKEMQDCRDFNENVQEQDDFVRSKDDFIVAVPVTPYQVPGASVLVSDLITVPDLHVMNDLKTLEDKRLSCLILLNLIFTILCRLFAFSSKDYI